MSEFVYHYQEKTENDITERLKTLFSVNKGELDALANTVNNFLKEYGLTPKPEIYESPFMTVTHVVRCRIVNDQLRYRYIFPLEKLHNPDLRMFYEKKRAPNLVIFLRRLNSSALLTNAGCLVVLGNKTRQDIEKASKVFVNKILFSLSLLQPQFTFTVGPFRRTNQVMTNRLVRKSIWREALVDECRSSGMVVKYVPKKINFVFIHPLKHKGYPSIHLNIASEGGIVLKGVDSRYAAMYIGLLMSSVLSKCITKNNSTDEKLQKAELERQQKALCKRTLLKRKTYAKYGLTLEDDLEDT